jgi:predicted nucleic acid-binding protein
MKVLIDTNTILDVLQCRTPFCTDALRIFEMAEAGIFHGFISASAITDIHYILCKAIKDSYETQKRLRQLLMIFSLAAVTESEITAALDYQWKDFEDAVQYAAAVSMSMDCIVTRNTADYQDTNIPALMPSEFLKRYDNLR